MGKDLAVGWEEMDGVEHHVLEELTKDQRWGHSKWGGKGWEGRRTGDREMQQFLVWSSRMNARGSENTVSSI